MLEEICAWRARLGNVIMIYTPAHKGITPNEYADAAAKAGARRDCVDKDIVSIAKMTNTRPCMYGYSDNDGNVHIMDRPLFALTRKMMRPWIETRLGLW